MDRVKLYNTMSRRKEEFKPIDENKARMYACGPTVYSFATIGNLRAYIFDDTLRRVLEYAGYEVTHGMNITDVGHLASDSDEGEDKLEVGARREKTDPLTIARKYEKAFLEDLEKINVEMPYKIIRATESIPAQIELIKILVEKGFTYKGEKALYFDTTKLTDYGKLTGQRLEEKKVGVREEVVVDTDKKNPQDFALWFFLVGKYKNHILHWLSPWGEGFPGWHIECSAISREILGQPFDIHLGAVDLIGTHHTNEIAQSEAAFDKPLANYWMHNEYLLVDGQKMSKSLGNTYTLDDLAKKGFEPADFRYFVLGAHYRSKLNFTWQGLESAKATLRKIRATKNNGVNYDKKTSDEISERVQEALFDDLDTTRALAILHEANDFLMWKKFDVVLGLGLEKEVEEVIPEEVVELAREREEARKNKDWTRSDEIRMRIEEKGYKVEDMAKGPRIYKI